MPKGYSLHIGLNRADANHYPGMPELRAAVNDAVFWEEFARTEGYTTQSLHDEAATAEAVTNTLADYATQMLPGDILLLTYAGHGGEIRNEKPKGFDNERNDQTWCLYDRQLLDDELYECFEKFKDGTRILVVSDSCHSGTITRVADIDISELLSKGIARAAASRGYRSRKLSREVQQDVVRRFGSKVYKPILDKYETKHQAKGVKAAVKLLAACQDDQETLDGEKNGIFTEAFGNLFKDPDYRKANCETLIAGVSSRYFYPHPNFFQYGGIIPSFDYSFPFSIEIPEPGKVTGYRKPDLSATVATHSLRSANEKWDMLEMTEPAVILLEIEGTIKGKLTGGKEAEILEKKTRDGNEIYLVRFAGISSEQAWSAAHALRSELEKLNYKIIAAEPVLTINPAQRPRVTREGDADNPDYIKEWPPSLQQGKIGIGWHLDDEHSQLSSAHKKVLTEKPGATVRIGHFDTGYIKDHIALPAKLKTDMARSFVSKEDPNQAIDKLGTGQDGHGLGTVALLAGNKVPLTVTFNEFEGEIGGAPFAEVVPMRISESVVIFNASSFAEAIDYAIESKCEVISMSMAGKPDKRMARAVNKAYDAGIVMVTAASNCWYKGPGALLPKCVMFPAAFERVIAATGAMYDHRPYDVNFIQQSRMNIGTKYMQGSWGPASRMTKALAAYTPNTPWASANNSFVRSGGGTSSATPQVAAAAGLWIAYHRDELERKGYYNEGEKWKKVEAVRYALYKSAAKDEVFPEWKKYYGNGILRALKALDVPVADASMLTKAEKAESSFFGVFELVGSFFKNRKLFRGSDVKPNEDALATELLHLLQTDPAFYNTFSELDLSNAGEVMQLVSSPEFKQKVLQSKYASDYLKQTMIE